MGKWKGYKTEWKDGKCRFTYPAANRETPWFTPLRWKNGDLGRFEFLRVLKAWRVFLKYGSGAVAFPAGYTYATCRQTTGEIVINRSKES